MANAVSVDMKTINAILTRLDRLTKDIQTIKKTLFEEEPPYGSDLWWKWSEKKALNEIKEGKGTTIHNKQELNDFFKNL